MNIQREVELVQASAQLRRVQQDLAAERRAGAAKAEFAAATIASLQQELSASGRSSFFISDKNLLLSCCLGAFVLISAGVGIFYRFGSPGSANHAVPAASTQAAATPPPAAEPVLAGPVSLSISAPASTRNTTGKAPDLPASLSRLNRAFASFPGRTAQEVLRAIQANPAYSSQHVCSFAWTEAGPALLFGKDQKGTDLTSLGTTLNRCAEAIEQSR